MAVNATAQCIIFKSLTYYFMIHRYCTLSKGYILISSGCKTEKKKKSFINIVDFGTDNILHILTGCPKNWSAVKAALQPHIRLAGYKET